MRAVILALGALLCVSSDADAQGTRCSAFLHERDGSWRSFVTDDMLLPDGPVAIQAGERFSRKEGGKKGFIARLLDAQCEPGGALY